MCKFLVDVLAGYASVKSEEKRVRVVAVAICILVSGCAVPTEFYSPDVKRSERITVGACGNLFGLFRRELTDGVTLEMWPYTILLRVEGDNSFRLSSSTIEVLDKDLNLQATLEVSKISTGVFFSEIHSEKYGIKEQDFEALETIQGTGRYESIDVGWGVWSPWLGKRDIFRLTLASTPQKSEETLYLDLPGIYVNEDFIEVEPIKFEWVSRRGMACVQ